jgi:hypothetical protein
VTGQRRRQTALLAQSCRTMRQLNFISSDALNAMSQDDKLIDLNTERAWGFI